MIHRRILIVVGLIVVFAALTALYAGLSPHHLIKPAESTQNASIPDQVLSHFRTKGDSLGVEAANALLAGFSNQFFLEMGLYDSNRVEIPFDFNNYKNFDSVKAAMTKLYQIHRKTQFLPKRIVKDTDVVSASLLIENIELSLKAYRTLPWAKGVSKANFLEYVIPYRSSNEKVDRYRQFFLDRYKNLAAKMKDSTDEIEAATLIYKDVSEFIRYDSSYYFHPSDQSFSEMLSTKCGRCEDIANFVQYACRAVGLAVASDYVPFWANHNDNHNWNVLLTKNGRTIAIETGKDVRETYQFDGMAAKVYRKTLSLQQTALFKLIKPPNKAPQYLDMVSFIDVTPEYVPVTNINARVSPQLIEQTNVVYLNVFHRGEWKPIEWAPIENKAALFKNVGKSVLYCMSYYRGGKNTIIDDPFLLQPDGKMKVFNGNGNDATFSLSQALSNWTPKGIRHLTTKFLAGSQYILYHMNGNWKMSGVFECKQSCNSFQFENIPENRVYILVNPNPPDGEHPERIFTILNGKQYWW